nr:MAG: ORF1 [Torque teno midi virus]UHK05424.1 MAG: ORF1 [Torque teno midi virus]
MPFWWRRRRKPWYGKWRFRRRRRYNAPRRKRKFYQRRRYRRTNRRRRKYKVRRKKRKTIAIRQWQPESITKCKIIGFSNLVLGAEGTQYLCWTSQQEDYTQPKAPGGGGFGCELINLDWLYSEWVKHNNIWTKTNTNKDLVRYTGANIYFLRHPTIDFVIAYSLQPPFELTKFTYPDIQPQNLLLRKRKRIILSLASKPHGKRFVKVKIRPPKQMITKWFFQHQFSGYGLVQLSAAAATFRHPNIGPKSQNQMVTIYFLDTTIFNRPNWAQAQEDAWTPAGTHRTWTFEYQVKGQTQPKTVQMPPSTPQDPYKTKYATSISRDYGWWQKAILNSTKVTIDGTQYSNRTVYSARYNPNEDTGQGNAVYLVSLLQSKWTAPSDDRLVIVGQPLWMCMYGLYSYYQDLLKDKNFNTHYMFVIRSPAIKPITVSRQDFYPFIDWDFINGVLPWEEYLSEKIKATWYPQATFQTTTINALVESGPFVPRLTNIPDSTWELVYKYKFFFKWGGPQTHDDHVQDPKHQPDYDTPDTLHQTIQIGDPKKQTPESIIHEWDYRRGFITQTALKRMSENIQTDTDFQSDDSASPRKKRKVSKKMPITSQKEENIKKCLLSLCQEETQETPENLQELIQQQQQQQHLLKRNLLQLLTHLKQQQRYLSLQTGILD